MEIMAIYSTRTVMQLLFFKKTKTDLALVYIYFVVCYYDLNNKIHILVIYMTYDITVIINYLQI